MRPTDARIWHPNFLIFNDSIIQESSGEARFRTLRRADNGGESRKSLRSVPLWTLELSNLQLSQEQYEEMKAFGWENRGMRNAFLVRNSRNCLFENSDGAQVLGVGDGTVRSFQLVKTNPIQGRTGQYEVIRFPNFRYPALEDWNCDDWDVLPELKVFVNGVLRTSGFDVNRTTGLITFDAAPAQGAVVSVTGGFYTLMLSNVDGTIPVTPDGPIYRVSGSVTFQEPEGGAQAELLAMGLL